MSHPAHYVETVACRLVSDTDIELNIEPGGLQFTRGSPTFPEPGSRVKNYILDGPCEFSTRRGSAMFFRARTSNLLGQSVIMKVFGRPEEPPNLPSPPASPSLDPGESEARMILAARQCGGKRLVVKLLHAIRDEKINGKLFNIVVIESGGLNLRQLCEEQARSGRLTPAVKREYMHQVIPIFSLLLSLCLSLPLLCMHAARV